MTLPCVPGDQLQAPQRAATEGTREFCLVAVRFAFPCPGAATAAFALPPPPRLSAPLHTRRLRSDLITEEEFLVGFPGDTATQEDGCWPMVSPPRIHLYWLSVPPPLAHSALSPTPKAQAPYPPVTSGRQFSRAMANIP